MQWTGDNLCEIKVLLRKEYLSAEDGGRIWVPLRGGTAEPAELGGYILRFSNSFSVMSEKQFMNQYTELEVTA